MAQTIYFHHHHYHHDTEGYSSRLCAKSSMCSEPSATRTLIPRYRKMCEWITRNTPVRLLELRNSSASVLAERRSQLFHFIYRLKPLSYGGGVETRVPGGTPDDDLQKYHRGLLKPEISNLELDSNLHSSFGQQASFCDSRLASSVVNCHPKAVRLMHDS